MTIQTPAHVIAALARLNLPLDELIPVKEHTCRSAHSKHMETGK